MLSINYDVFKKKKKKKLSIQIIRIATSFFFDSNGTKEKREERLKHINPSPTGKIP